MKWDKICQVSEQGKTLLNLLLNSSPFLRGKARRPPTIWWWCWRVAGDDEKPSGCCRNSCIRANSSFLTTCLNAAVLSSKCMTRDRRLCIADDASVTEGTVDVDVPLNLWSFFKKKSISVYSFSFLQKSNKFEYFMRPNLMECINFHRKNLEFPYTYFSCVVVFVSIFQCSEFSP